MNENTRLEYLAAMGIESWVLRRPLPGAAKSRRRQVVSKIVPAASTRPDTSDRQQRVAEANDSGPQSLRDSMVPAASKPVANLPAGSPAESTEAAEAAPAIIFSAAVVFLGGWYWIDEVSRGRDTGPAYGQLLQAIAAALNFAPGAVEVERFDWPLPRVNGLDPGLESARHSFEGFMRARLERRSGEGAILLGCAESDWLNQAMFADMRVVATVSAWDMLRDPSLKAQAWQTLRPLRRAP